MKINSKLLIVGAIFSIAVTSFFLSGKGSFFKGELKFDYLNSYQKQKYWQLMNSCLPLLKNKQNSEYRSCALNALQQATNSKEQKAYCTDSDGVDYFTKGKVISDLYPDGIYDSNQTFSNGKTYIMEGACNNANQYVVYQKNCQEFGSEYSAVDGICQKKDSTIEIKDGLKNLKIDYTTKLVSKNGAKINFIYSNGELIIYSTENFGGTDKLTGYTDTISATPYFADLKNSNIPEIITVSYFDNKKIIIDVKNPCQYEYCNVIEKPIKKITYNNFEYYIDDDLFDSPETKNAYIEKTKLKNQEAIEFLKDKFGFTPPIKNFLQFDVYSPGQTGYSYAWQYAITDQWTQLINNQQIENLQTGNTHELVHVFLTNTMVSRSWFEEGLADFMAHYQINGKAKSGYNCGEKGWQEGYYSNGQFIENGPFVPYSNFNVIPENTTDFYNPLNKPSYYRSAECFWIYIYDQYGEKSIKSILQKWDNTRSQLPPIKTYKLIKDIITPIIGADLSNLVYQRYSYSEEEAK